MTESSADSRDGNRKAWNRLARSGSLFARTATDEELRDPLRVLDGRGWLADGVRGRDVLCLASGGGWQSILYAAAGARVTVVDLSEEMLRLDDEQARRRGLSVRTISASMDDLSVLDEASFDVVHQPVSTCYVPSVEAVYRQVARVLKDDGIYISQHKQPISLQVSHRNQRQQFVIGLEYYHEGPLPRQIDDSYRESGTTEYLHRLEQLLGGLCRSGFVIEDVCEPMRADWSAPVSHYGYRGRFVPPYLRILARRRVRTSADDAASPAIWVPTR